MRIAINCRSILLQQRTGIGRYLYYLLDSLGRTDPLNEYVLYAPKRLFDLKRRLPDFFRYKNFTRRLDYFQQGPGKVDVYHMPSPWPVLPFQGKLVVTIHDLIYKMFPQGHPADAIELTHRHMTDIVARSDHIICVSENTRRDLHALFHFPMEKSCVIYHGVDHHAFYVLSDSQRQWALNRLKSRGVDRPYILYVGTIEPRKNLAGLIESFAILKSKKIFDGQLVVAGMPGWERQDLPGLLKQRGIHQDVVWTGFVSDEELCSLYNMAQVFVFPSFYEGFGFPILEAFCCGAPVVTSNTSSCGEIAKDAAITIDPKDPSLIAQGITQILQDHALKEKLVQAGLKRAQGFSFTEQAIQTLKVYQQTGAL